MLSRSERTTFVILGLIAVAACGGRGAVSQPPDATPPPVSAPAPSPSTAPQCTAPSSPETLLFSGETTAGPTRDQALDTAAHKALAEAAKYLCATVESTEQARETLLGSEHQVSVDLGIHVGTSARGVRGVRVVARDVQRSAEGFGACVQVALPRSEAARLAEADAEALDAAMAALDAAESQCGQDGAAAAGSAIAQARSVCPSAVGKRSGATQAVVLERANRLAASLAAKAEEERSRVVVGLVCREGGRELDCPASVDAAARASLRDKGVRLGEALLAAEDVKRLVSNVAPRGAGCAGSAAALVVELQRGATRRIGQYVEHYATASARWIVFSAGQVRTGDTAKLNGGEYSWEDAVAQVAAKAAQQATWPGTP